MNREDAVADLEQHLGYTFVDRDLLEQALTHASISGIRQNVSHNERLEFLGDRVLGLLTAELLTERYPDEREGMLSNRLHGAVNREACARVARRIGLPGALRRAGVSTRRPNPAGDTLLADACEALLAALYLDAGLERTREIYRRIWNDELEAATPVTRNPKVELQEWLMGQGRPPPRYEILKKVGPDHEPTITVQVSAQDMEPAQGTGRSRQEAEKAAARIMLERETRS